MRNFLQMMFYFCSFKQNVSELLRSGITVLCLRIGAHLHFTHIVEV